MSENIYIAKLGKSVGLNGDIKIFIDTDFPDQLKAGLVLKTDKKTDLTILKYNHSKSIIHFEEINSIDEAKKWVNTKLYTTVEDTKQNCILSKNQYFWFDLIDCIVYDADEILGKIKEIVRYGETDYFVVQTYQELINEGLVKSFLIPYIMDRYIVSVDITNKKIITKDTKEILQNS